MNTTNICYRKLARYKYQTPEDYTFDTGIRTDGTGEAQVEMPRRSDPSDRLRWVVLAPDGTLTIRKHYAWDGASGVPDLTCFVRASLVHDALYQLIREGELVYDRRGEADRLFARMAVEDGLPAWLEWLPHAVLTAFGGCAARRREAQPTRGAPRPCTARRE